MRLKKTKVLLNHKVFIRIVSDSGLTQEEFAEAIDVSDRYVRMLETKDRCISVDVAYNISQFAGCSIESLLIVIPNTDE